MIVSSAPSQSKPRFTGSSARHSTAARHSRGTATVTYPASARSAAIAARTGAPVVPGAPPTTSTAPAVNFESRAARRGTCCSSAGVARRTTVSTGVRPMSATTTSPAWNRPGATWRPTLLAWKVIVSVAFTATPATSPVEASTPDGRSTATTGSPAALIRSISAAASDRGAPRNPVPKRASITTSQPSTASVSTASRPASLSTRAAIRPSPPFEPPPQTTANRRAYGYTRMAS